MAIAAHRTVIQEGASKVTSRSFSPCGRWWVARVNGFAQVVDLLAPDSSPRRLVNGVGLDGLDCLEVSFAAGANRLLTCSSDGHSATVWDFDPKRGLVTAAVRRLELGNGESLAHASLSSDGEVALTVTSLTAVLWRVATETGRVVPWNASRGIHLSTDGTRVVGSWYDRPDVLYWDSTRPATPQHINNSPDAVEALLSLDGETLITREKSGRSLTGAIKVYNIVDGSPELRRAINGVQKICIGDMAHSADGMALSDDKGFLAIFEGSYLLLFDLINRQEWWVSGSGCCPIRSLKFSPNNRFLAVAHDAGVGIVDLRQATPRLVSLGNMPAEAVGVYATGHHLGVTDRSGACHVIDLARFR